MQRHSRGSQQRLCLSLTAEVTAVLSLTAEVGAALRCSFSFRTKPRVSTCAGVIRYHRFTACHWHAVNLACGEPLIHVLLV